LLCVGGPGEGTLEGRQCLEEGTGVGEVEDIFVEEEVLGTCYKADFWSSHCLLESVSWEKPCTVYV
jgi:hypothetical protein